MNRIAFILALLISVNALGRRQTTQSLDRTTPRGAANALRVAIEAGDEAALRDLLHATTDEAREMNDALASVLAASSRLSLAASEKFGASNDPIASRAFVPATLVTATTAPVEVRDDTATISLSDRDHPLKLVRGPDGFWRIDLLAFAGATTDQAAQQAEMYRELSVALNELATDTRGGRFMSVSDLKAALQDRVHGTIAKSMRKPGTTTAPSSGPSTSPLPR